LEHVILVDELDNELGLMEKIEAHKKGKLHRAFSVFVFNEKGQMLLQQRAFSKYHSGGLWTNTCCSHQRRGESNVDAAKRRLQEEMGFVCDVEKIFDFTYYAALDQGLIEHEFDHVFVGHYNEDPLPNPDEVAGFKWMTFDEVDDDMKQNPALYTAWFRIIFDKYANFVRQLKN